jgi:hypothetical protein
LPDCLLFVKSVSLEIIFHPGHFFSIPLARIKCLQTSTLAHTKKFTSNKRKSRRLKNVRNSVFLVSWLSITWRMLRNAGFQSDSSQVCM